MMVSFEKSDMFWWYEEQKNASLLLLRKRPFRILKCRVWTKVESSFSYWYINEAKDCIALLKYVLALCRTATLWSKVAFDVIKVMIKFKSLTTDDIIEHESKM